MGGGGWGVVSVVVAGCWLLVAGVVGGWWLVVVGVGLVLGCVLLGLWVCGWGFG